MKLLKVKVPRGYMMLVNGFEIDFLIKSRVDKNSVNDELLELDNDFYYPIETVFIGKNSSGKTTTLSLIQRIFILLRTGRINNHFLKDGELFELELTYYHNNAIYEYCGTFKKDINNNQDFLIIEKEKLRWAKIKQTLKKDLSNATFFEEKGFMANVGGDTSNIVKYQSQTDFNISIDTLGYSSNLFDIYYSVLKQDAFLALVRLFDDSIDLIAPHVEENNTINGFDFKRTNDPSSIVVREEYLESVLSAGTIRGINLYGSAILAFKAGGTIMVDEIEKSFNRNLIENLLLMFNDKSINKKKASIIYSTHYSELLDNNNRCDNINVLHRKGNEISLKNVRSDYKCRTDMLKSSQFNQNAFDTLINYERLMDLKDAIR